MLEYKPREQFLPFHNRRHRWASMCTHRRAGKTVALVNDVIVGALECPLRKPQLAYVGPTYAQSKRIAWTYLKDYSEAYWSKPPSESELKVTLHGDRTIYCLGSDNPDSLRGMYLDGGVGDEYALFRPTVFSTIIRPALSDRNGWWVFASTPRGKNIFHKVHTEAQRSAEWYHLTLKASQSGILPLQELEDLRKDMDPEEYAQEYECSFDAALKGAIYADEINSLFHENRVRPSLYDPALPTHFVFDLGYTDATVRIAWQEHKDGSIRVVNTAATQGKEIGVHIQSIQNFPDEVGDIWLPHDARAKSLQTGMSIVEQFLDSDIRPRIVPGHKVRDRIAAARKTFPRVYIDSTDKGNEDLIEALKGYRREWDENTMSFREHPMHDWCSDYADGFGYMTLVATKSSQIGLAGASTQTSRLPPGQYNLMNLFADHDQRASARLGRIQ